MRKLASSLLLIVFLHIAYISSAHGQVTISGELQRWHKITLDVDGPASSENATPNPFTDYRFSVTFRHPRSGLTYTVPGYFAADGNAAETSATSGKVWRAHLCPDHIGKWTYTVSFRHGNGVATDAEDQGKAVEPFDGLTGTFTITESDKQGRDFRAHGRLQYDGSRYLKFAGTGKVFLKCGVDAPENFLAYQDFDGNFHDDGHKDDLVKTWEPHVQDWRLGDPTWQNGKGKGMIGSINYLHDQGLNAFSFLTNNIIGDDQNVFPYTTYDERLRMDCSKLDQWEIVFSHGDTKGMFLHFKTFEVENQLLLDGGDTGPERKLYYRELIARFGHHLALNWNMCEENGAWGKHKGQNTRQRIEMARFVADTDPYGHHLVIHNGVQYNDILGPNTAYTGASVQTSQPDFRHVHGSLLRWLKASGDAGKQWAVAIDEPGDAKQSLKPDSSDPDGVNHDHARMNALWGAYFAGAWGIEWYFGYSNPNSDLTCQDYRSRERMWKQCKIAVDFFAEQELPLGEMSNLNKLIERRELPKMDYCFGAPGKVYLVYLKTGSNTIDLTKDTSRYRSKWFNPRSGRYSTGPDLKGGLKVELNPPTNEEDWILMATRA